MSEEGPSSEHDSREIGKTTRPISPDGSFVGSQSRTPTSIESGIRENKSAKRIALETRGADDVIGYEELSPAIREEISEDEFDALIVASINHEASRIAQIMDLEAGFHPQDETEQFKQEIENPHFQLDPDTNINYAVYRLNSKVVGKPLVVKVGWSSGANSRGARPFLNALAEKVKRPIIAIDTVATGKTSIPDGKWIRRADFDSMADSEKRVLDKEFEESGISGSEFDLLGVSMGGIQAAKLAERYGKRVGRLLTFSAPGFRTKNSISFGKGFATTEQEASERVLAGEEYGIKAEHRYYEDIFGKTGVELDSRKLPHLFKAVPSILRVLRPVISDVCGKLPPEMFTSEQVPAFFKFFQLMTKAPLADLPKKLAPETRWGDLVGSKDAITDMPDHLKSVRSRNEIHPHTSSAHILGSASHSWITITTEIAEAASRLLREDKSEVAPPEIA